MEVYWPMKVAIVGMALIAIAFFYVTGRDLWHCMHPSAAYCAERCPTKDKQWVDGFACIYYCDCVVKP